jgi:HPr kinase/phosphorylase
MPPQRVKSISAISVGQFYKDHAGGLNLSLLGTEVGFDRPISEPAMNRPGLALAGFFSYFAPKRVQVLGNSEISYLRKLPDGMRADRFRRMCDRDIPCVVVARGIELDPDLLAVANEHMIPVFSTAMVTMNFLNAATIRLEHDFAPSVMVHGCMIDTRGVGVLLIGGSGSGKSETAIGLIERGSSLVADDLVKITYVGGELMATAPKPELRSFLEIRGIGIIDVTRLYGFNAISKEKRVDLVVLLKPVNQLNEVDRSGLARDTYEVLERQVDQVTIPVGPGRDTARLVTIAALGQQLKILENIDMADEFNSKVIQQMNGANGTTPE